MTDWLPDLTAWTPADWRAASGVGTLVVASVATLIARRQLRQARELREEEAAPFVVVDVEPSAHSNWVLDLVIENVGKTVAHDVTLRFGPALVSTMDQGDYRLADWSPLKDGVRTMVPGRRLRCIFDSAHERHKAELPKKYEVVVSCTDSRGRKQPEVVYVLDLEPLYSAMSADAKGMHQLVDQVERLRKAIEPISKKRLTVEVFDGESEIRKRIERRDEWRRQVRGYEERQGLPQSEPDPDASPDEEGDTTGESEGDKTA